MMYEVKNDAECMDIVKERYLEWEKMKEDESRNRLLKARM